MSERTMSKDLKPGDTVIWVGIWPKRAPSRDRDSVLDRRKNTDDGWWIVGGGGIADSAIDDPHSRWVVAS